GGNMRRTADIPADSSSTASTRKGRRTTERIAHRSWYVARRTLHHPSGLIGTAMLGSVVALVLLAPFIAHRSPTAVDINTLNQLPSGAHPFGTDYLGRDLWSRVLYGGQVSLLAGIGVVCLESSIGVTLGLVAGFTGRYIDAMVMRLMDALLIVPGLLLALGIVAILGPGLSSTIIAIGVAGIPGYARMARAMALRVRHQEYVLAAQAAGTRGPRIVRRHVLPNSLEPLIVMATISFGGAVLAASALSYLGVGVQSPTADWGTLLSEGYTQMYQAWSELVFPGIAVVLTVLGGNLLGDGLTDALNPRL
ncbi:MAG TPA: ABC transporter permease, partial [Chloroflexota bacterium]